MNKLEKIISEAKKRGHDVRVRDVGYAVLVAALGDNELAHKLIFGDDGNIEAYAKLAYVKFLVNHLKADELKREKAKESEEIAKLIAKNKGETKSENDSTISFEENRAGMEEQIREIREAITRGMKDETLDDKTFGVLQKTLADLRSKLNDKFGASEKAVEQYIIVQKKYDYICPHTQRECYQITKEEAMARWNLIEKENI